MKNVLIALLGIFVVFAVITTAHASQQDKVTLCHHTESESNPWVGQEVNANEVQSHLDNGDFLIDETHSCPPSDEVIPTVTPTPTGEEEEPTVTPTEEVTPTPTDSPSTGGPGDGLSDGRSDGRSDGIGQPAPTLAPCTTNTCGWK